MQFYNGEEGEEVVRIEPWVNQREPYIQVAPGMPGFWSVSVSQIVTETV
jgi:hypothetical protein